MKESVECMQTRGEHFQPHDTRNSASTTRLQEFTIAISSLAKHTAGQINVARCNDLFKTNHNVFYAEISEIKLVNYADLADETSIHTFFMVG